MASKEIKATTRHEAMNVKIDKFEQTLEEIKQINQKNHTEALENYMKIQNDIKNMKDVIIKNLINENKNLKNKIKNLEKKMYD